MARISAFKFDTRQYQSALLSHRALTYMKTRLNLSLTHLSISPSVAISVTKTGGLIHKILTVHQFPLIDTVHIAQKLVQTRNGQSMAFIMRPNLLTLDPSQQRALASPPPNQPVLRHPAANYLAPARQCCTSGLPAASNPPHERQDQSRNELLGSEREP